jgi:hypothetical protein
MQFSYECINPDCKAERTKIKTPRLFDALQEIAGGLHRTCPKCQRPLTLRLHPKLALGAGDPICDVVAAFLPRQPKRWKHGKNQVTYFPFLVVTLSGGQQDVWLPYWHTETDGSDKKTKYGQWAPWMAMATLKDLLNQARAAGYAVCDS